MPRSEPAGVAAWDGYAELGADDRVRFCAEPAGIEKQWRATAGRNTAAPKLWMDAYLAAFAGCSGMALVTTDAALRQFDTEVNVILIGA